MPGKHRFAGRELSMEGVKGDGLIVVKVETTGAMIRVVSTGGGARPQQRLDS
jgi:hypothetical protein